MQLDTLTDCSAAACIHPCDRPPVEIGAYHKGVELRMMSSSFCRRVELVLLHDSDADPKGTLAWLQPRPQLQRHHHIRLANDKVLLSAGLYRAFGVAGLRRTHRTQAGCSVLIST
jgi:hypothetical protein